MNAPTAAPAVMTTLADAYDAKPRLYYEQARPEMLAFVPRPCRRVLDVGCSNGSFGELLRRERGCTVWGLEPFAEAANEAATRLDHVVHAPFDVRAPLPPGSFDGVVFNDVLEHLLEPGAALELARRLLAPGGVVIASIPNIRHFPTLWHLAVHGSWEYRDCGTLDRTHLRFFTRSSIARMFDDQGFDVRQLCGLHPYRGIPGASTRVWRLYRWLNFISGSRFNDMKFERFAVVAQPKP